MPMNDLLSAAGALALVIGLIVLRFGSRFVQSRRPHDASIQLRLTGQLALDGRRRLQLVQCGSGQVLLLTGGVTDIMLPWPHAAGPSA